MMPRRHKVALAAFLLSSQVVLMAAALAAMAIEAVAR